MYTIIIPHKNIPDLLQRCLDSIPRRDDVQIVVVDDNSDADKVDFDHFPGLNDPYVEVVFAKNEHGRMGAGYARNLGLERAKGKWLVFADADDFFNPCFGEALDRYKEDGNDIVFFQATSVDSDSLQVCNRGEYLNILLARIEQTGNWDIALKVFVPWAKFIKRELVEKNGILFQEVPYSNDVLFSVRATQSSQGKVVDKSSIYCVTQRENSLTGQSNDESIRIRFEVVCQAAVFLKKYGKEKWILDDVYGRWIGLYRETFFLGLKKLPKALNSCGFAFFRSINWRDINPIRQTYLWMQLSKMKSRLTKR